MIYQTRTDSLERKKSCSNPVDRRIMLKFSVNTWLLVCGAAWLHVAEAESSWAFNFIDAKG